jgi:hypothetical protein
VTFFRDMLKGIGNAHWDIARITALWAVLSYSGAFLYALIALKKVPDWSSLGVGYAAVLAGAVAFVAGKDISTAKAAATVSPPTTPVQVVNAPDEPVPVDARP